MVNAFKKTLILSAIFISASGVAVAQSATPQMDVTLSPAAAGTVTKNSFSFTIPAGGVSPKITPPVGVPVSVTAVNLTQGYRGVASVTMLRIKDQFLEWTGLSSPTAANIEANFSGTPGTHIAWIDYSQLVDLQVASPNAFYVKNNATFSSSVKVTLIY